MPHALCTDKKKIISEGIQENKMAELKGKLSLNRTFLFLKDGLKSKYSKHALLGITNVLA